MRYIKVPIALAFLVPLVTGCDGPTGTDDGRPSGSDDITEGVLFSFEESIQEWTGRPPEEAFEGTLCYGFAERANELSHHGSWSARLFLDNGCDAGRIWIEREFSLRSNTTYEIRVAYWFATRDGGDLNVWDIIGGAQTQPFQYHDLLTLDNTASGQDSDAGFVWLNKEHTFEVTTGDAGVVFLAVGVWGTWETTHQYFIDSFSAKAQQR